MDTPSQDSFKTLSTLKVGSKSYQYFDLQKAEKNGLSHIRKLPRSLKVLLENLLRFEDGVSVKKEDILALNDWIKEKTSEKEIAFRPARVLMQDFTGVPAVVDLASMRQAMEKMGGDTKKINPLSPVDLVIDHSVQVDIYASKDAFAKNVELEYERNKERYEFLRWGQSAFTNFRVVPPGTGICHQVNLEYLAQVVWTKTQDGAEVAYPDTLVGTDSHTTMVNGLSVLGWGVGGIEAEAAMLGQPISMLIPEVVGFKLKGKLREGATATDVVLTATQMLRKKGVVGKFVEFYGEGLTHLSLADRATLSNMAPEYGATCGFFPIDQETLNYLRLTSREEERVQLVEAYAKAQGLWMEAGEEPPVFTDTLELDLGEVQPSLAGPKRPQDRVLLSEAASSFKKELKESFKVADEAKEVPVAGADYTLKHGDVVIAAITSCTNTSNPSVMLAAGLVAKKAREKGLTTKPWVKTSLAPGSQVVTDYLIEAGLQNDLDAIGFNLVGYGCTTCIGNSGPLQAPISAAVHEGDLVVSAVLSGNRNFEGRVNPDVRANYLASPPLVVVYALAGNMKLDLMNDPIGTGKDGRPVYFKDIWPTNAEIQQTVNKSLRAQMFKSRYSDVFKGDKFWQELKVPKGQTYLWQEDSTYIKNPPYFEGLKKKPTDVEEIKGAKILALLGDSVTTDHISPAGNISGSSPAAKYLTEHGVAKADFNSYGARRGNHEVMMRGTFANIRLKNEMLGGKEGGLTLYGGMEMSIYDAAMEYKKQNTPLVIFAGKEYGTGSSRDWAAKGTTLLGVRAVVAESFERIHRSNLIGMGVLPLQFIKGETRKSLGLDGTETVNIEGMTKLRPGLELELTLQKKNGETKKTKVLCRIDTENEVEYYLNGGILHYVLRNLMK